MSGSGSRAMLARSAAGLIPAMAATAVSARHRRSSGSLGSRNSCCQQPTSTSSSSGAAAPSVHFEQRRAPSATPPRRHRTQFFGTIDETATAVADCGGVAAQKTAFPGVIVTGAPGATESTDDVKARNVSQVLHQPEIEIVVHPARCAKRAAVGEETASTSPQNDVHTTSVTLSRSDNTLRNVTELTDSLVAIGNGFIHTT